MSRTVIFRETALRTMARIRREDRDAFTRPSTAIAALADEPYPENAVAWGATGIRRSHTGEGRVLYQVDDEASAVYIINIGLAR